MGFHSHSLAVIESAYECSHVGSPGGYLSTIFHSWLLLPLSPPHPHDHSTIIDSSLHIIPDSIYATGTDHNTIYLCAWCELISFAFYWCDLSWHLPKIFTLTKPEKCILKHIMQFQAWVSNRNMMVKHNIWMKIAVYVRTFNYEYLLGRKIAHKYLNINVKWI